MSKENRGYLEGALFHQSKNQQAEPALTFASTYHLLRKRPLSLKIRTSSELFPRLIASLSQHLFVKGSSTASLELDVNMKHPSLWTGSGTFITRGLGLEWWRIAPVPIEGINLRSEFEFSLDRQDELLSFQFDSATLNGATVSGEFHLENFQSEASMRAELRFPKQACATGFRAIPESMLPRLDGLTVAGDAELQLSLSMLLDDPYSLKLKIDGNMDDCTVLSLGHSLSLAEIRGPSFIHRPEVEGEEFDVEVGPGTPSWVPYFAIPSYVAMAAVATEDLDFFVHNGFKVSLIRRALKLNLDKERYVYGGSTISQQLVKNLFLSRERRTFRESLGGYHHMANGERARQNPDPRALPELH